jgi:hypothetical protein
LAGPQLTPEQAVRIGIGVLAGLRALQRAGSGHGALDTSTVFVSTDGVARLTRYGSAAADPRADVAAAGRVLCALLGGAPVDDGLHSQLVAAARAIATGAAGGSATNALMIFGDAAGRIDSRFRIERSMAALEQLAVPPIWTFKPSSPAG